ncbi:zf-TFIIB domain-containing protein [Halapricum salinum]|uniref:Zinc finger FPG/IleRS-type domain-containing protein n=1 Tax=Halapricum salinum TaxID=1457250 RepID=A0A4D6HAY2_9EURY|nr:zf-TFIIB domain-containing protein [Halapricum salinum]QCC50212.1 hypothetical protein DV733_02730 [Halapricum salinum]
MDCSRCGGELETYSLGEKEAYVCTDCGFADTPVEHEATKRPEPEPWAAALKRFHEKFVEGDAAIVGSGETAALVEIDRDQSADEAVPPTDDVDEKAVAGESDEKDVAADENGRPDEAVQDDDVDDASEDVGEEREKPA